MEASALTESVTMATSYAYAALSEAVTMAMMMATVGMSSFVDATFTVHKHSANANAATMYTTDILAVRTILQALNKRTAIS